jgi:hypothetical protein
MGALNQGVPHVAHCGRKVACRQERLGPVTQPPCGGIKVTMQIIGLGTVKDPNHLPLFTKKAKSDSELSTKAESPGNYECRLFIDSEYFTEH